VTARFANEFVDDLGCFAAVSGHGVSTEFIHQFRTLEYAATADEYFRVGSSPQVLDELARFLKVAIGAYRQTDEPEIRTIGKFEEFLARRRRTAVAGPPFAAQEFHDHEQPERVLLTGSRCDQRGLRVVAVLGRGVETASEFQQYLVHAADADRDVCKGDFIGVPHFTETAGSGCQEVQVKGCYRKAFGAKGVDITRGDIGFGESDGTVNLIVSGGYRFPGPFALQLGYRYVNLEYTETVGDAEETTEIEFTGPFVGALFRF